MGKIIHCRFVGRIREMGMDCLVLYLAPGKYSAEVMLQHTRFPLQSKGKPGIGTI